jgi:tousled-like kinase
MRLGNIGYERTGAEVFEHWIEGKEYIELRAQRQNIESELKQIEILKADLVKAGKSRRKSTSTSSIANSAAIAAASEDDDEEVATQAEVYKTRLAILKKNDSDLEEKAARLDIEKALLIKELKRISDEDHSPWNNYPVLGDNKYPQRFVLLHLVGKGGFSEVYKAYDLIEQRPVACKIHQLAAHWSKSKRESYYRHAIREGEIQERMAHARVVRLFNIFSIDETSFCTVMEYCKGGDLDTYLKQQRCLPEAEARSIVTQVFQGLRYMNEQEKPVIHYDLKPGNIMFDEFGGVKITDFGLSKTVEAGDSSIELTSQGAGTYWYLPPECFDSPRDLGRQVKISNKVDVWSCGVIFYQMLYGKKPFGDKMSQQKILMENTIATSNLEFPAKSPKGVTISQEARDFIKRLLTRSPSHRPDVFAACADAYLQVTKKKGAMGPPSSRKKGAPAPPTSPSSNNLQLLPPIALGASAGVPGYQQPHHDMMDTS